MDVTRDTFRHEVPPGSSALLTARFQGVPQRINLDSCILPRAYMKVMPEYMRNVARIMSHLDVQVGYVRSVIGWIGEIHSNPGKYAILRGFNNLDRLHMRFYIVKRRAGTIWCFRTVSTKYRSRAFIIIY